MRKFDSQPDPRNPDALAYAFRRTPVEVTVAAFRYVQGSLPSGFDGRGEMPNHVRYIGDVDSSLWSGLERLAQADDLGDHELTLFGALADSPDRRLRSVPAFALYSLMRLHADFAYPRLQNQMRDYVEVVRSQSHDYLADHLGEGSNPLGDIYLSPEQGWELHRLKLEADSGRNLYYPGHENEAFARLLGSVVQFPAPTSQS